MTLRSFSIGFVLGVLAARAYTQQLTEWMLSGTGSYVFGEVVQSLQGQLLNGTVIVEYARATIATSVLCLCILLAALLWPPIERMAMVLADVVDKILDGSEPLTGETRWNR
ncbi:hypothetical protein [Ottowia sp.]|uniref:hypothetical protein n=1 Tax=Ottowia sp. TaxID=1898956 RepID=UPI0025CEDFDE|nr:hypothetical protein [Ottowia sp.]MBK6616702.1 hypothetical protein [Ottowia sp.]